jgi:NAD(P)-dependent dehydrogenase (short-subunit alcohol dehydrogenase family)
MKSPFLVMLVGCRLDVAHCPQGISPKDRLIGIRFTVEAAQGDGVMAQKIGSRIALVAGGTGGLGRAVSLALLAHDYQVAVTYREQREWDALQSAAGANQANLEGTSLDVANETAVGGLIQNLAAKHGRLDALINAVGGYAGGVRLWELETKVFDQMLALNLRSGFALCRAAVPVMLKQGYGSIVNVSSKAAFDHAAGAAAYASSKAAAIAMIDSLAAELKGTGVRVNSIVPSIIDTEANRKAMPDSDFAKWPKPEDIARVILFLCGDDAKVIHGASLPVYGDR